MSTTYPEVPDKIFSSDLYNADFLGWLKMTIQLLKSQQFREIDLENLIEELESMGRSEKNALESNLRVVLMHLLKYKYQQQDFYNSWLYSIREHRLRVNKSLQNSPSLKGYLTEIFPGCYEDSRHLAADETALMIDLFPPECPFTIEQTLDVNFLPNPPTTPPE